jgi:hypothetical protein
MPASVAVEQKTPSFVRPVAPDTVESLGIPRSLVSDIFLRYLWLHGSGTLAALHSTMKLSFPVLESMFHQFRQQQLLDVKGMMGNDYTFTLTGSGRAQASARNEICQYAGPAPVSLEEYRRVVNAQAARVMLSRATIKEAFTDLVLPDTLLDQLGPALIGQQSLFLYGGTGNGKTSIAERILRIYKDTIVVPYAVEVDGNIIAIYDPVVHHATGAEDDTLDRRWVVCERPCITVGGELCKEMLELRLDPATRVFTSPSQMKANNGILIIDDFGRQVMTPRELLNRWIVPLDRRVDYLTLASGMKFATPFELMVVFSTNLDPHDLADEAFLRRIQSKVLVEHVSDDLFDQIFQRVVDKFQTPCDAGAAEYLRQRCYAAGATSLRACYPWDIYKLVRSISEYECRPIRLTHANMDRAVSLYFPKDPSEPKLEAPNLPA